jgi:large subunit ribosomal protein L9e
MKSIVAFRSIDIPLGVTIKIRSKKVKITGPRGKIIRDFKHILIDLKIDDKKKKIFLKVWFANKKRLSGLSTVSSHISNSIIGVTIGFQYRMRSVYAHFPINIITVKDGQEIEIRNFLGEKKVRKVFMAKNVICKKNDIVKDEILIYGNDLSLVSLSAAQIQRSCLVKNKDIRKFLDGIYVSVKENIC